MFLVRVLTSQVAVCEDSECRSLGNRLLLTLRGWCVPNGTRFHPKVYVARCVNIMDAAHDGDIFSLEHETSGDPVAGTLDLVNDVVDALL